MSENFKHEIRILKDKLIKLEGNKRDNDENIEKVAKLYEARIIN